MSSSTQPGVPHMPARFTHGAGGAVAARLAHAELPCDVLLELATQLCAVIPVEVELLLAAHNPLPNTRRRERGRGRNASCMYRKAM